MVPRTTMGCPHEGPRVGQVGRAAPTPDRLYLTGRIYQSVLESELPHNIVNSLFTITYLKIQLTVSWGSCLSQTNQSIHCVS